MHSLKYKSLIFRFLGVALVLGLAASCSKSNRSNLPDNFNSLSTPHQMEVLMESMGPDSVATIICDIAMGKVEDTKINLQEAIDYAYQHYNEDDQVTFDQAMTLYQFDLPLGEKVRLAKLSQLVDPDMYSYELGLEYVGFIRENNLQEKDVEKDLADLKKECKGDPEFYKRFMKGFKTALEHDRHHDLNDKIYLKFISYPDNL